MSLQMLLEGPDLDAILREVEANYGREFRVIQAEQVRSGGMAGFFAKQHYEVTIEISNPDIIAGINAQKKKTDVSLTELATRSQNDQAAASTQEWARELLRQARELNSDQVQREDEEPQQSGTGFAGLVGEDELPTEESSRWTRTLGRLAGKKSDQRLPSDRMLAATRDQQLRLRDLLASPDELEDDTDVRPMSPAAAPVDQAQLASLPEDDSREEELPPAARIVAEMDPWTIPGLHVSAGGRPIKDAVKSEPTSQVAGGVAVSDSTSSQIHGELNSTLAALEVDRANLRRERDELAAYREQLETLRNQLEAARTEMQDEARRENELHSRSSEIGQREPMLESRERLLADLESSRGSNEGGFPGRVADIVATATQLDQSESDFKSRQQAWAKQRALADIELADAQDPGGQLRAKNGAQKHQLAAQDRELQQRAAEIEMQTSELALREQVLAERLSEVESRESALDDQVGEISSFVTELQGDRDELASLRESLAVREEQIRALESQVADHQGAVESARADLAQHSKQAQDQWAVQVERFEREQAVRCADADARDEALAERASKLDAQESALRVQGEQVAEAAAKLSADRQALEMARAELAQRSEQAQDELAARRDELELDFAARAREIQARQLAVGEQASQISAREQELITRAQEVEAQEISLQTRMANVVADARYLRRQREALSQANCELEEQQKCRAERKTRSNLRDQAMNQAQEELERQQIAQEARENLASLQETLEAQREELSVSIRAVEDRSRILADQATDLARREDLLVQRAAGLDTRESTLSAREDDLDSANAQLKSKQQDLQMAQQELEKKWARLSDLVASLVSLDQDFQRLQAQVKEQQSAFNTSRSESSQTRSLLHGIFDDR